MCWRCGTRSCWTCTRQWTSACGVWASLSRRGPASAWSAMRVGAVFRPTRGSSCSSTTFNAAIRPLYPSCRRYYKKNSASRPGPGLLSIAAYKSIRSVLYCLIRPVHIFCVRYRSFLPGLVAEFPTVLRIDFIRCLGTLKWKKFGCSWLSKICWLRKTTWFSQFSILFAENCFESAGGYKSGCWLVIVN